MLASAPYHQHSEHNFSYDMRAPEWSKFIANSFSNSISLCMFWKLQRLQEWLGRGIAQNDKSASNSEAAQPKLTKLGIRGATGLARPVSPARPEPFFKGLKLEILRRARARARLREYQALDENFKPRFFFIFLFKKNSKGTFAPNFA